MPSRDAAIGNLIFIAQANYAQAPWWRLAVVWLFGRHHIVRHIGRVGRIGYWRERPYLLSFRETFED